MNTTKTTFKIIDAPTGAGKTTAIIKLLNTQPPSPLTYERFIVLTPLLSEVERICAQTTCRQPLEEDTGKLHQLKQLIINGENICATHSLFNYFDNSIKELLTDGEYKYTLIVDEEPSVILDVINYQYTTGNNKVTDKRLKVLRSLNKCDYRMLRNEGYLLLNNTTGQLMWNNDKEYTHRGKTGTFNAFRKVLEDVDIYSINNEERIVAVLNPVIWMCFDTVYISTYRFQNSYFDYYCKLYNFNVEYYHINTDYNITEGFLSSYPTGLERLVVCDNPKYNLCNYGYSLSKNWFNMNCKKKDTDTAKALHNALRGFLRYGVPKEDFKDYYWTTFKDYKRVLTGRDVSPKHWIAHNTKATNTYSHCNVVAFVCNKCPNPNIERFLHNRGIKVDRQEYALSCLIQFVWRSAIRNSNSTDKVYVYIPAERMRIIFNDWLHIAKATHKKG